MISNEQGVVVSRYSIPKGGSKGDTQFYGIVNKILIGVGHGYTTYLMGNTWTGFDPELGILIRADLVEAGGVEVRVISNNDGDRDRKTALHSLDQILTIAAKLKKNSEKVELCT